MKMNEFFDMGGYAVRVDVLWLALVVLVANIVAPMKLQRKKTVTDIARARQTGRGMNNNESETKETSVPDRADGCGHRYCRRVSP